MATDLPGKSDDLPTAQKPVVSMWPLLGYFLKLGTTGFGGPAALVGYMLRDLVQERKWISEDEYKLSLALAQIMPGPLAAQTAIAICYFQYGILGATLGALAFVLPSFVMVLAISAVYVAFGGAWWLQALFYGIGPAVIAIIAVAAYRLARSTNKKDYLLWAIFLVLAVTTAVTGVEVAVLFILAGLLVLFVRARPRWLTLGTLLPAFLPLPLLQVSSVTAGSSLDVLGKIFVYFAEAGAFVFGSGLAIVPFLHQSVVVDFGWLNEHQFLDAVAVAMITPGPVVITVAFIGYLVAGVWGAIVAAIGIFLPCYLLTVAPAPWFRHNRENAQLKAFVAGATAAATGAIAGAVVVIAARTGLTAITAGIVLVSLVVLWRFKVKEPYLVTAAGVVGLVVWPLVTRV